MASLKKAFGKTGDDNDRIKESICEGPLPKLFSSVFINSLLKNM
jgi:hypothetical protein